MACSKIFSGDLPEITNDIIQYLQNDLKSLYSCVLVNRLLCRIATPILWEDPFSVICQDGYPYNLLNTYLSFFNENDQTKLKDFGIIINSPSFKKPLFNYPSFIKTLNTYRVELHTINWMNNLNILPDANPCSSNQVKSNKITFWSREIDGLKTNLSEKTMHFICISLFKLFMNNNASLNNLYIIMDDYHGGNVFEVYESILNNSKFISNIENFTLNYYIYNEPPKFDVQILLTPLPSLLSLIKHLDIYVEDGLSTKNLPDLIRSQNQLLSLTIYFTTSNVLDIFKYRSNTLTSIKFNSCDFTNILSFDGLKYLTQLKSLQLIWCIGLTTRFFQSLLDLPAPLKIKSLKVIGQTSGNALLLQKVGPYLENLELRLYEKTEKEKVFESIINYCDKIQFLNLSFTRLENIPRLHESITHLNRHLKYLSLQSYDLGISSMILKGLGQRLPDSLEYLDLNLSIDPNDMKIFLDHCKHIGLNKLLVKNFKTKNVDIVFNILKEFVREQKLENFAYLVDSWFNPNDLEHQNLERLVNEFQPFVKMRRYDNLILKIFDI